MDGGGRLLRSLGAVRATLAPAPLAFATAPAGQLTFRGYSQVAPQLPTRVRRRRKTMRSALTRATGGRFTGTILALAFLGSTIGYGFVRGGGYDSFVASQGRIPDVLARAAGFSIKTVTVNGLHELTDAEVIALAGLTARDSLPFLNVAAVRARLTAVPLIKDASVSKLFPSRLLIEIDERQPSALWQKDGVVSIVAADGTPIDEMKDLRFERLPLVVGDGANAHLAEYLGVFAAAGEMRDQIRAGIYVAGRRWTLKLDNGIEVALPEKDPADAVARLAKVEHDSHVLEKDILSVDMRFPGRLVARLSPDAAAARADALAKKSKKKSAAT